MVTPPYPGAQPSLSPYVTYVYDQAGQLSTITRANGIVSTYTYDLRGRVLKIAHANSSGTAVAWETYDYDEAGRRLSYTDQSGTSVSYGYDAAGRLIQEKYAGGRLVTYGYDAVGNRKNKSDSADPLFSNTGSIYDYSYDPQNDRLLQVQRNGSVYRTYTYDNAGRVSSVNGTAVTWTFDGQVASIGGTSFSYDGEGNRIGKTTGTTTTSYLVDPTWAYTQVAETDQGTTKTRNEWGIGLLKEGANYSLSDGLDTLRALASTSGAVTSTATYLDAFGYPTNTGGQLYGLNGQVWDPETELYYLRARYYDPKTGRFISQDPFEGLSSNPVSLHRYIYGNDTPANIVDPTGLAGNPYLGWLGTSVHETIRLDYVADGYVRTAIDGLPRNRVLTEITLGAIVPGLPPEIAIQRPADLIDLIQHDFYQIKPANSQGIMDGLDDLTITWLALGPTYHPGEANEFIPTPIIFGTGLRPIGVDNFNLETIVVFPPISGLILYQRLDKRWAKYAVEFEKAKAFAQELAQRLLSGEDVGFDELEYRVYTTELRLLPYEAGAGVGIYAMVAAANNADSLRLQMQTNLSTLMAFFSPASAVLAY